MGLQVPERLADHGNRVFKQAQGKFGRQDLAGSLIDAGLRDAPVLHGGDDGLEVSVTLHVDVDPGLHGDAEGFLDRRHPFMIQVHALDIHPVADHDAVESQFILEQGLNQPGIAMAGDAVDLVVGGHHGRHVQVGRKGPGHAALTHLLRCLGANPLHQFRMESGGHVDIGRVDGATFDQAVAMDGIDSEQQRNAQTALLRDPLQAGGLFDRQDVQEGADLPGADLVRHVGVTEVLVIGIHVAVGRALSGRDIAGTDILAHLADFLLEGHLLQEGLSPVGGRQGSIFPVSRSAGGRHQEQRSTGEDHHQRTFHSDFIYS